MSVELLESMIEKLGKKLVDVGLTYSELVEFNSLRRERDIECYKK